MLSPRTHSNLPAVIGGGVAGLVAVGASLDAFGEYSSAAFGAVGVTAVITLVRAAFLMPKGARHPWVMLATAVFLVMVAAALRDSYHTVGDLTANRSLVPDLASLPGYVLLAVALGCAVRIRRRDVDGGLDAVLDGCLAGLAALALAWVFLIEPALARSTATIGVRLSIVAYPPLSVVFVVMTCQIAFARGAKRGASILGVVVAMVFLLIGDVFFTIGDAKVADFGPASWLLPYAIGYGAIVFFCLHPSFVEFAVPLPADNAPASPARLAFVSLALTTPAMVSVTQHDMATADRVVLATIIFVLTATATWRVVRALQHHARSEKALLYQATHDLLTGSLNRSGLIDELSELAEAGIPHAVLFVDMDRFKLVNDSFGHSFGDDLLIAVAERLRASSRRGDVVARIGGDEFVVVTTYDAGIDQVVRTAEELRQSFSRPFLIRDTEIPVSISVGIATSDLDGGPGALLRDADTAMYGAKDAGRDSVLVFDNSMRDRVSNRLELERDLRHALDRDELAVHFQPVVDMVNSRTLGFEALMRWNHPMRGTVPPLEFIPIAEETGVIVEIGAWILDHACQQLAYWRGTAPEYANLWCSVNVSARQLRDADFVFMVERSLAKHALPPDALVLEVTESLLVDEGPMVPAILNRIRDHGIRLSIDDFGTGYSSLAYVQRFPFSCVKIDRAFVDPLDNEGGGEHQLVGAIVAMAAALGLDTIAEGVETQAQADRLVELGCVEAQGYLYSRPVPPEQIPATLRRLNQAWLRPLASATQ